MNWPWSKPRPVDPNAPNLKQDLTDIGRAVNKFWHHGTDPVIGPAAARARAWTRAGLSALGAKVKASLGARPAPLEPLPPLEAVPDPDTLNADLNAVADDAPIDV